MHILFQSFEGKNLRVEVNWINSHLVDFVYLVNEEETTVPHISFFNQVSYFNIT